MSLRATRNDPVLRLFRVALLVTTLALFGCEAQDASQAPETERADTATARPGSGGTGATARGADGNIARSDPATDATLAAATAGARANESGDASTAAIPPDAAALQRLPCDDYDHHRNLYWGDLHVHTARSGDAWRSNVRATPDDAYRFARGEAIAIPPLDERGIGTQRIVLDRPLDFAAVTDHAETFGILELCATPGTEIYDSPGCAYYRRLPATPAFPADGDIPPRLEVERMVCGDDWERCIAAARTPWQETQEAAERWQDSSPTCAFTTFLAYEWSGARGGPLLHRNVIFRNGVAPPPMGSRRAPKPDDLFDYLEAECLDAETGCDVLSIPHNANTSSGQMFRPDYSSVQSAAGEEFLAKRRRRLEPLVEIMQHKGDSECRNGLVGILGGPDELCGFEKLFPPWLPECDEQPSMREDDVLCVGRGGYARTGLAIGLAERARIGVNPFEFGFIAATDTHNANPGDVDEADWNGHVGDRDATPAARMAQHVRVSNTANNPGGLAGVWARENSREAIFDALRRRETYGTSGPRIAVRLFASWEFPEDLCERTDFVEVGYRDGVPMGDRLPVAPSAEAAPVFALHARADPGNEASPGNLLQRGQIVKVWNGEAGEIHQRIFEIAGDPASGAGVDPATCAPRGPGARELCRVWRDPAFDPTTPAVYYARVVENPSCRWQTRTCVGLADDARPAACEGVPHVDSIIQERAWTSPVWYDGKTGGARARVAGALSSSEIR